MTTPQELIIWLLKNKEDIKDGLFAIKHFKALAEFNEMMSEIYEVKHDT